MTGRAKESHRGVTLVEVAVLIALLSVSLGLVAKTLTALYKADDRFDKSTARVDTSGLLDAIRRDTRRAASCISDADVLCIDSNGTVRYQLHEASATRVDDTGSGGVQRFRLDGVAGWKVSEQSVVDRRLLRVALMDGDEQPVATVVAEIGRDRRTVAAIRSAEQSGDAK